MKTKDIRKVRLAGHVSFYPISCNIWEWKDSLLSNSVASLAVSARKTTLTPDKGTSAIHCPVQKLSLEFIGCKVSNISHREGWQDPFLSQKKQRKERPCFWRLLISIDHRTSCEDVWSGKGENRAALSHPVSKQTERSSFPLHFSPAQPELAIKPSVSVPLCPIRRNVSRESVSSQQLCLLLYLGFRHQPHCASRLYMSAGPHSPFKQRG